MCERVFTTTMFRHQISRAARISAVYLCRRLFATKSGNYELLRSILTKQLQEIKEAGTYKRERIITSAQSSAIRVQESSGEVLNFCANNYLGLANNKQLIEAAKRTMDKYGFGLSSVRFICGTQDIHKELEKKLAQFHGTEDTILYASAFDANGGIFEALLGEQDAVFSDALNHASIIDVRRINYVVFSRIYF